MITRQIVNEFTGIQEAKQDFLQEVMGLVDTETKSLERLKGKLLHTTGVTEQVWSLTQLRFRSGTVQVNNFGGKLSALDYLPPFSGLLFPYPIFEHSSLYPFVDDQVWPDIPSGEPPAIDDPEPWNPEGPQRTRIAVALYWDNELTGDFTYNPELGYLYPAFKTLVGIITSTLPTPSYSLAMGDVDLLRPADPPVPSEENYILGTISDGRQAMSGVRSDTIMYQKILRWTIRIPLMFRGGMFPEYPTVPPYHFGYNPANFVLFAASTNAGVGYIASNNVLFGATPYEPVELGEFEEFRSSEDMAANYVPAGVTIWKDGGGGGTDDGGPDFPKGMALSISVGTVELTEWADFTILVYNQDTGTPIMGMSFLGGIDLTLYSPLDFGGSIEGSTHLTSDALLSGTHTGRLKINTITETPQPFTLTVEAGDMQSTTPFNVIEYWVPQVNAPAELWDEETFEVVAKVINTKTGAVVTAITEPTLTLAIDGCTLVTLSHTWAGGIYTAQMQVIGRRSLDGSTGSITANFGSPHGILLVATDGVTYKYPVITVTVTDDYSHLGDVFNYGVKYYNTHQAAYVQRTVPITNMGIPFGYMVGSTLNTPSWNSGTSQWEGTASINTISATPVNGIKLQGGCPDGDGGFFMGEATINAVEDLELVVTADAEFKTNISGNITVTCKHTGGANHDLVSVPTVVVSHSQLTMQHTEVTLTRTGVGIYVGTCMAWGGATGTITFTASSTPHGIPLSGNTTKTYTYLSGSVMYRLKTPTERTVVEPGVAISCEVEVVWVYSNPAYPTVLYAGFDPTVHKIGYPASNLYPDPNPLSSCTATRTGDFTFKTACGFHDKNWGVRVQNITWPTAGVGSNVGDFGTTPYP